MTIVNHFFVMNGYYYVLVEKHVKSDKNLNKTKKTIYVFGINHINPANPTTFTELKELNSHKLTSRISEECSSHNT